MQPKHRWHHMADGEKEERLWLKKKKHVSGWVRSLTFSQQTNQNKNIVPQTCSLDTLLRVASVVVGLDPHRWNYHGPDAPWSPVLLGWGGQGCQHGGWRRAVVVVKVTVGVVATLGCWCVRRGRAFHRVTTTFMAVVLRHAEQRDLRTMLTTQTKSRKLHLWLSHKKPSRNSTSAYPPF